MCMKYVNVNTTCYKTVSTVDKKVVSFIAPLRSVDSHVDEQGNRYTDDFTIVTQIGFVGTNSEEHKADSVLCSRETVDIIIRLTKRTKNEEHRLGGDLDCFSIDLNTASLEEACFEYYNYTRITDVSNLKLPAGSGAYVIKVLIKRHQESKYSVQSIATIVINN